MDLVKALELHKKWIEGDDDGVKLDISGANMRGADMRGANMNGADMRGANMNGANMSHADMIGANMSGAVGLEPQWLWVKHNLTQTEHGYVCYKTFGEAFRANCDWTIEEGSTIAENVNFDRCNQCACGINVATLEWVLENTSNQDVWECLIPFEGLAGVCVPYNTDGKFRCEMVQLAKKHNRDDLLMEHREAGDV